MRTQWAAMAALAAIAAGTASADPADPVGAAETSEFGVAMRTIAPQKKRVGARKTPR